ncbi:MULTISPECIES: endolytic transglycosylase MltG [unclassified Pseudoalteromonas]|uniref:endolytic transglycosylase MltG n=1 Tax=unclassified Pseudoalteromonas TaxID=194690 RepID=UPI0020980AFE|nr:endolytic transglycosylase MltG [Pseudoalteromonas sp. XMcav2-N]MCO7187147.1 endolytic transglycosylase MltG [Pseudoalteromonas sp. XMcav2-N]
MIKKLILLVLSGLFIGILAGAHFISEFNEAPLRSDTRYFEVKRGDSFVAICRRWQHQGWVENCLPYQIYGKLFPERVKVKAGVYELQGVSVLEALSKLNTGVQADFMFTIIEGQTFKQVLANLKEAPFIHFDLSEKDMAKHIKVDASGLSEEQNFHPEGWLYPETYHYHAHSRASSLIKRASERMHQQLAAAWQQRAADLPISSAYEALILASIIEKETGKAQERPVIASVFVNRLNRKMRLQTDPTVIYGLGERFDGDIKRRDLREHTPYNTYRIKGLPPTPIAMPSFDAIQAATQPARTDYLYFVSKGDGSHYFSKSLREHNQAVKRYILNKQSG